MQTPGWCKRMVIWLRFLLILFFCQITCPWVITVKQLQLAFIVSFSGEWWPAHRYWNVGPLRDSKYLNNTTLPIKPQLIVQAWYCHSTVVFDVVHPFQMGSPAGMVIGVCGSIGLANVCGNRMDDVCKIDILLKHLHCLQLNHCIVSPSLSSLRQWVRCWWWSEGVVKRNEHFDIDLDDLRFYSLQTGNVEMTWVISDFVGSAGTNELSVTKGQQVEVLEMSATVPDFCLVRATVSGGGVGSASTSTKSSGIGGGGQPQEGLVPLSILKPPPTFTKTSPRRTLESSGMCD